MENKVQETGASKMEQLVSSALYQKHLTGKILCIVTDCCFSGQWIVECTKCLDSMKIGACGHQTREQGLLIKIYATCQPDQKVKIHHYVSKKGIYYNDSVWLYYTKNLSDTQTTHGFDFTRIKCLQLDGSKASCRLSDIPAKCSWKWEQLIAIDCNNRPGSLIFIVRGTDRGQKAWHLVLVERKMLESFHKKLLQVILMLPISVMLL